MHKHTPAEPLCQRKSAGIKKVIVPEYCINANVFSPRIFTVTTHPIELTGNPYLDLQFQRKHEDEKGTCELVSNTLAPTFYLNFIKHT
jgi:hypothetical protein